MSSTWISVTPKLEAGVKVLNSVESSKIRLLVNRIVLYMQQDHAGISAPQMFTKDEEAKLEKSLGLKLEDVHLLIETSFFILQQAAYHKVKPELLQNKLESLQVEQERATVISNLWSGNAGSIIENLKHKSVLPQQLADISWMVMVETSSDVVTKQKEPVALLELLMKSSESKSNTKVQLKMNQSELLQLYHKLEHVQSQLDSLK